MTTRPLCFVTVTDFYTWNIILNTCSAKDILDDLNSYTININRIYNFEKKIIWRFNQNNLTLLTQFSQHNKYFFNKILTFIILFNS